MRWMYMPETFLGPFAEMRRLQREMNRAFNEYREVEESFPPTNIWSNDREILVKAELPGIDPKAIDITVQRDQLTLQGERQLDQPVDNAVCHRNERGAGKFVRTFKLPYDVDETKVSATYANGILSIAMPRTETSKPKRISVSAA